MKGLKTVWTDEMIEKLTNEFPFRITADIGSEMNLSLRTLIRKARELGLEKEDGFLDKNRNEISNRAQANKKPNPMKGVKGWTVPGGEKYQFKKGQPRPPVNYVKIHQKRNDTIRKEKLRLKYGLKQQTNLKLVNIY